MISCFVTVDKVAKTRRVIKRNSIRRIVGQGLILPKLNQNNIIYRKRLERTFEASTLTLSFLKWAVHTYSSTHKKTKFISLSRSLTACRNL